MNYNDYIVFCNKYINDTEGLLNHDYENAINYISNIKYVNTKDNITYSLTYDDKRMKMYNNDIKAIIYDDMNDIVLYSCKSFIPLYHYFNQFNKICNDNIDNLYGFITDYLDCKNNNEFKQLNTDKIFLLSKDDIENQIYVDECINVLKKYHIDDINDTNNKTIVKIIKHLTSIK